MSREEYKAYINLLEKCKYKYEQLNWNKNEIYLYLLGFYDSLRLNRNCGYEFLEAVHVLAEKYLKEWYED